MSREAGPKSGITISFGEMVASFRENPYTCSDVFCYFASRERTGLVVRALDSGSGDLGSILGRVGVLFPWARDIYSPKALVIPRNRTLRLNMTEKLFTGTLNKNQNKTKTMHRVTRS